LDRLQTRACGTSFPYALACSGDVLAQLGRGPEAIQASDTEQASVAPGGHRALRLWASHQLSASLALPGSLWNDQILNLRGVLRFPVERYAERFLPSQTAPKTSAAR
jgi:hypothetical protein